MIVSNKRTSTEALEMDVLALAKLVGRRMEWLGKTENRLLRTYQAIAEDTRKMQERLAAMRKELEEEKNFKKQQYEAKRKDLDRRNG
jgi:hypothetical protein